MVLPGIAGSPMGQQIWSKQEMKQHQYVICKAKSMLPPNDYQHCPILNVTDVFGLGAHCSTTTKNILGLTMMDK